VDGGDLDSINPLEVLAYLLIIGAIGMASDILEQPGRIPGPVSVVSAQHGGRLVVGEDSIEPAQIGHDHGLIGILGVESKIAQEGQQALISFSEVLELSREDCVLPGFQPVFDASWQRIGNCSLPGSDSIRKQIFSIDNGVRL